ncbi:MAG: cache domain-containing protein [Gammaproteobacteria bacterium]|nr:cache domain-containing protein [Gammaproteobacteria bacterium]
MRSLRSVIRSNLRYKLLLLVALPFVVIVPAILGGTIYWSRSFSYDQLYQRVTADLAVAGDAFQSIQRDYLGALASTAESYSFRTGLRGNDDGQLLDIIELLAVTSGFDFVHLTDHRGRWWFHGNRRHSTSKSSPLMEQVRRQGIAAYGVEVYTYDELVKSGEVLGERARIPLVATPRAQPSTRDLEDRALILRSIYPLKNRSGQVVAMLDAGVLINRNFEFVDRIRDLVYGPGSVAADGWGTVSVTLGDVRISTNVPLAQGERALGTRESAEVRHAVLDQGSNWVDRTFVVNDWYISAYKPIVDVQGKRVGMLHTSFLETPYRTAYFRAITVLASVVLLSVVALGAILARGAHGIFRPIESMMRVVRATKAGQDRRIGPLTSQDEIGELAREFDTMLESLAEKNRQITAFTDQLEEKVASRTGELRRKNRELQRTIDLLHETRQQLAIAEKLAALGELTAGVAHEINNPIAVILGNLDVLVKELGQQVAPVQTEIDLIIEQIYRVRAIVEKLLHYSRPAQYAGDIAAVDIKSLVDDTLLLVKHELAQKHARVDVRLDPAPTVHINRRELQQVLVNLLLNAIQAIDHRGSIEITSRPWHDGGVILSVLDHGAGIAAEKLARVFDPFYTSKDGGTGLGLPVSYGIVRHYGGHVTVASEQGKWTRLDVYLRHRPVYENAVRDRGDFAANA